MRNKVVFITDIHLGRDPISPWRVLEHLERYLYPVLAGVDEDPPSLLLFGGDFFDRLLDLNQDAGRIAVTIVDHVVELAVKHGFFVRVLAGTFSHDRFQNKLFNYGKIPDLKRDDTQIVRVFEERGIEYIKPLNLHILYSPDNQNVDDLTDAVLKTLSDANLDHADILASHTYFDHLYKNQREIHQPSKQIVSQAVRKKFTVILNGHIHVKSIVRNIVTGGSFERFCHAEEAPKGFHIITLNDDKLEKIEFRENYDTDLFNTYEITDDNNDAVLDQIEADIVASQKNDRPIHIRLVGEYESARVYLKEKYPTIDVAVKSTGALTRGDDPYAESIIDDLPTLTPANIVSFIVDEVHQKLTREEIEEMLHASTK